MLTTNAPCTVVWNDKTIKPLNCTLISFEDGGINVLAGKHQSYIPDTSYRVVYAEREDKQDGQQ